MIYLIIIALVLALGFAYSILVASAKPVTGSDYYKVSRDGRVMLSAGSKVTVLKPTLYPEGLKVKLRGGTREGEFYVHDLVAEVFLPNPNKLPAVRHRDGNVRNNRVENLQWVRIEEAENAEPEQVALPQP
ncbi:HNH endonuclease [Duganella lactea]|nr:HNH endonuclease [Duganella lactea]